MPTGGNRGCIHNRVALPPLHNCGPAGGWLWERGARGEGLSAAGVSAERLTGWGQALVLQGAFLFIFDVVLAERIARERRSLE
ncbi:MAG: DUF6992 family protein [Alkalispirochaeta sp.]